MTAQILPFPSVSDHQKDHQQNVLIRETSPRKVRERWAAITLYKDELSLQAHLHDLHVSESLDPVLCQTPAEPKPQTWLQIKLEQFGTLVCRLLHPAPDYRRGDQFSSCPSCDRKYALPWADVLKVDQDVYFPPNSFVAPQEATKQAVCRDGLSRWS